MKTQTIRYGENGGVEIIDIDVSDPQAGEVQVQSAACGVCAWDLATFREGGAAPPRTRRGRLRHKSWTRCPGPRGRDACYRRRVGVRRY